MALLYDKIEKIEKQSKTWIWYGKLSPLLFVFTALGVYGIEHTAIPFILYGSWVLLITTSVIWWFWVIKVITEMTLMFKHVIELVQSIKIEIADVHKEIKNLDNSRKN